MLIHSYTPIDIYSYIHVLIQTYIHTYIHAYAHSNIHTYIHTYAHSNIHIGKRMEALESLFEQGPAGQTPLCYNIRAIIIDIERLAPQLRENNQKVVVVICTGRFIHMCI